MNTANSVLKYEVIYYKRSKKVHKTKGVSRLDGILTIAPPPSNLVTLCGCCPLSGAVEAEAAAAARNSKQPVVYSGKNAEVVKRFMRMRQGGLLSDNNDDDDEDEDNDIVILSSSWECQIVREIMMSGHEEEKSKGNNLVSDNSKGDSTGNEHTIMTKNSRKQILNSCSSRCNKTMIGPSSFSEQSSNSKKLIGQKRLLVSKSLVSGFRPPLLKKKKCTKAETPSDIVVPSTDHVEEDLSNQQTQQTMLSVPEVTQPLLRDVMYLHRNPPLQPKRIDANVIIREKIGDYNKDSTSRTHRPLRKVQSSKDRSSSSNSCQSTPSQQQPQPQSLPKFKAMPRNRTTMAVSNRLGVNHNIHDCFEGAIGELNAPFSIKTILRPHQQTGIVFLWNCLTGACPKLQKLLQERRGDVSGECDYGMDGGICHDELRGGAILADEMGLGKTLMTITVIFALHRRNRNERFIVVCPSSLVENWAKEFDKFVGKASQPKRVVVQKGGEEGLKKIKSFVPSKAQHSEVLIISYDLFRMNSDVLCKSTNIGLLVVDEGHRLKNTSGTKVLSSLNSLKCNARLLITGTPIQNNLSEFYNVANFVLPGVLGSLSNFRKEYEKPISVANKKNASVFEKKEGQSVSKDLNDITSVFMIRRLQKDILKSLLPPRYETLLFCRPSQKQCEMYKYLTKGPILDSLSTLTNLRKLCSHPDLLLEDAQLKNRSPGSCSESGKLDVLEGLLDAIRNDSPTDKVIVISNFTTALSVINDCILQKRGWKSVRLDGTTEQSARQQIVDSFNRSSVENSFVFLLSSKAGGCGLNLIGANRLIMYDLDWNPSTDAQAMARIYRQGQKKECFIYRLLTTGTVEEVMFQRQTQKNNLYTIATNRTSKSKSHRFTDEELRDCFTLKERCMCDTKDKIGKDWEAYEGVQSLVKKCVKDNSLLALARDKADVISYVHLVQDLTSLPIESDTESVTFDESCEEDNDWECFEEDSSDEVEFE